MDKIVKPHENQNVDLYGQGLERFNIVIENLPNVTDSQTMFDEVLSKTKFSLAYDPTNEWCSEFTSESEKYGDLTVDTPADEFKEILEDYAEKYQTIEDKRADGTLSYSAHSSVYDLNTLSLKVKFDETDEIFEFKMFTDDAMNDRVNSLEVNSANLNQKVESFIQEANLKFDDVNARITTLKDENDVSHLELFDFVVDLEQTLSQKIAQLTARIEALESQK